MRTSWSLALAGAGSALAFSPPAYGSDPGDSWSSEPPTNPSSSWSYAPSGWGSASAYPSCAAQPSGWGTAPGYPSGYPSGSPPPYPSTPAGYPSSPVSPQGESSAPAGGYPYGPSTVTQYTTVYASSCENEAAGNPTVTEVLTGTVVPSPAGYSSPAGADGAAPSYSPGEVYTTVYTTIYKTSTAGAVKPYTYAGWSSSYTHYDVSTCTEEVTKTVTHPYTTPVGPASGAPYPSGPAGYPSGYPSGPVGPASGYPSGYPSGPVGPASGYPSQSGWPHSYPAGNGSSWGPTGVSSGWAGATGTGSGHHHPKPTGCVPCEGQPGKNPETFCGLTVNDNWYDVAPKTCKTVEYHFTITNETISPDGVPRMGLVVNGQLPGPTIHASWGDTVIVHVTNNLPADGRNGTSFHFHGIRQNGTNEMDGVSSLTQCPIAPGQSMTYKWTANSYGTSWWHAHYALQTYEGIFGPLQIDGPLQSDVSYDDEQFILMQDWSHATADEIYEPSLLASNANNSRGPTLDTGLINGLNVWQGAGKQFSMTVSAGKTYRLRLINTAIQSTFKFYVDSHVLTVFAMDFVPITPYTTNILNINIGQRYDVLLKADQSPDNYWMRSDVQQPCGANINGDNIKAIVHYDSAPVGAPTSSAYGYAPDCLDEPYDKLNPIVPWSAGAQTLELDETVVVQPNSDNMYRWYLSGTTGAPNTFLSQWSDPTLKDIVEKGTIPDYSGSLAIEVPNLGEWVYVIIESPIPAPHPIHLHGHDFLILAQGTGTYSSSVALNLNNPPRRDVAVMPSNPTAAVPTGGYLVIAFYTSNPGVWLLHCHIGWHNTMGFALQIIENLDGIKNTVKNTAQLTDTCNSWDSYASQYNVTPDLFEDSGV